MSFLTTLATSSSSLLLCSSTLKAKLEVPELLEVRPWPNLGEGGRMKAERAEWVTELEQTLKVERAGNRVRVTIETKSPILYPGAPGLEEVLEKVRRAGAWVGWNGERLALVFTGTREEVLTRTGVASDLLRLWRSGGDEGGGKLWGMSM